MVRVSRTSRRSLVALLAVVALATSACSGSSGTSTPSGTGSLATSAATQTGQDAANGGAGSALGGAASNLANITSYKFSMTLAGDPAASVMSIVGQDTSTAPVTYSGTVIVKPDKAADINLSGLHVIEIGGYDYMDMGSTGGFLRSTAQNPSLVDSLSPGQMFSSMLDSAAVAGYNKVGSESKSGVDADHYQASASALAEYGSIVGLPTATWSGDIWIATNGGYPVSVSIIAKAKDNSIAYEMLFDITNINDAANQVTAPTDIVGA
jgi:hypothetical protein